MSVRAKLWAAGGSSPAPSSGSLVLQRKCACGNALGLADECDACRSRRLTGSRLQAKCSVNQPGDQYELEAERVAQRLMQTRDPFTLSHDAHQPAASVFVQRRTSSAGRSLADDVPSHVQEILSSPGEPLDVPSRVFFEQRFGHDFSSVRVHADRRAAASARALDALAYTVGSDIAFGEGRYRPGSDEGTRLLAHELTHVVQQAAGGSSTAAIQRAPAAEAEASAANVSDERFMNEVFDFLEDFRAFRPKLAGLGLVSSATVQLRVALAEFDQQLAGMEKYGRFGTADFYGLLSDAHQVLSATAAALPEATDRVRTESDVAYLGDVHRRLDSLNEQLAGLEGRQFIAAKGEEIEETRARRAETAAIERAAEFARRETPEGRRENAVEFTRRFVSNEHQWWPGQPYSAAGVFAERLGSYYLHEQKLIGADIQTVLARLGETDAELLDRALYQGRLLTYLFNEGVTGLSAAGLPLASGSGFYSGFEFTWRDLVAKQPVAIPSFSAPGPLDIIKYELGAQWGVLVGIKDGVVGTVQDVLSLFQVETYTQLYDLMVTQIWDEKWRYELGKSFATALHGYVQDVGNDDPFEIGKKLGRLVGQAIFEIVLGFLTAGLVQVATKALRGTKWGAALLDFAEDVAHAMPWREPKVVEDVVPADVTPAATRRPDRDVVASDQEPVVAERPVAWEEPAPSRETDLGKQPTGSLLELEASVAKSSHTSNKDVTLPQLANERGHVNLHPEIVEGTAPNRKAQIGEHEIVEQPDGGCKRRSEDDPLDVGPCPIPMQGDGSSTPVPEPTPYQKGLARTQEAIDRQNDQALSGKFRDLQAEFAKQKDPRSQEFLRVLGEIDLPSERLDTIVKSLAGVPKSELRKTFQDSVYDALADRYVEFPQRLERERINEALAKLHPSQKKAGGERIEAAQTQMVTLDAEPIDIIPRKLSGLKSSTVARLNELIRVRESEIWRRAWLAERQHPDFLKEVATSLVSEDLGVEASLDFIQTHFGSPTVHGLVPSPNQSGVFDALYSFDFTDGDRQGTTWIIGEAKGGESPQPSFRKIKGKYYEQGTMPHTIDTIGAMKRREDLMGTLLERALTPGSSDRVLFVKVTAQVKPGWKGLEGLQGRNAPNLASIADEDVLNAALTKELTDPLTDSELESALEIEVRIWELKP